MGPQCTILTRGVAKKEGGSDDGSAAFLFLVLVVFLGRNEWTNDLARLGSCLIAFLHSRPGV